MRHSLPFLSIALIMLLNLPASAHHSFGATYSVDKTITLKGKIAQVTLRSPHSFFYVDVDNSGKSERWAIEGTGAGQFAQSGIDRNSFKIGDAVEIVGNPARDRDSNRARLVRITRTTDGLTWGNRPGETVD